MPRALACLGAVDGHGTVGLDDFGEVAIGSARSESAPRPLWRALGAGLRKRSWEGQERQEVDVLRMGVQSSLVNRRAG